MPQIIFVEPDGEEWPVQARHGVTLMELAVAYAVPGIVGECGGACACATCHLVIDSRWATALPPPTRAELAMLRYAEGRCETSRLGCRLPVTEAFDGMRVLLPSNQ